MGWQNAPNIWDMQLLPFANMSRNDQNPTYKIPMPHEFGQSIQADIVEEFPFYQDDGLAFKWMVEEKQQKKWPKNPFFFQCFIWNKMLITLGLFMFLKQEA